MPLYVVRHPLISHKLSLLRNKHTAPAAFRRILSEVAALLAFDALRDLPLEQFEVETPLERTQVERIAQPLTIVPVLRAGLGLANAVLDLVPEARVGHIGVRRDEVTANPHHYYLRLPVDIMAGPVLVTDPMIATGGSAISVVNDLRSRGCQDIRLMCLVAAPEGVAKIESVHPALPIYTAAVDRCLDENFFIRPGLGDAGDRIFGT
ncbi:MAG: uracil phosphoribosyltransferase [Phycisphaerales bacterium]|nr:uracil phosphoribosyltransferase [Phycisphaerales bacterium]